MSEPPLPIIPDGQTRNFNLVMPEIPAPEGPGSGPNPSGAEPSGCDEELVTLIDAYTASPTSANRSALVFYIEDLTGTSIEALLSPEWEETASDCETRTKTVVIGGCEVLFTIDATLIEAGGCEGLPTYDMSLTQNDFHLGPLSTGTTETLSAGGYRRFDLEPSYDIHIDNPVLSWLPSDSIGNVTGYHIKLSSFGVAGANGPPIESPAASGNYYIPVIQIKGTIEAHIALQHTYNPPALSDPLADLPYHTHTYRIPRPPFAFRLHRRSPSGGSAPTIDSPIRVGTDAGAGNVANSDYPVAGSSGTALTLGANTLSEFWLPGGKSSTGGTDIPNPYLSGGTSTAGSDASSETEAWANFEDAVADYNASATSYDPTISVNSTTKVATISFDTDLSALYMRTWGCQSTATVYDSKFDMLTINWGGYYNHKTHSVLQVRHVEDLSKPNYKMSEAQIRYIHSIDSQVGIARSDYQRVTASEVDYCQPFLDAAVITDDGTGGPPVDGTPPPTVTNPPITPVGGGCRSSLFGPSSCNWTVPRTPDIPMPNDNFPDVPTVRTNMPDLPDLPCIVPDFGNMDPCGHGSPRTPARARAGRTPGRGGGAGPGTLGPLPGGRDRSGHRGGGAYVGVKTAGQTYPPVRTYTFLETTCPGVATPGIGSMAVIVQLLMDAGIDPVDIIFQVGPEWDKPFPADKCFERGSRIFDAAMWTAQYLMLWITDEGPPTNDVYIGPPWHRPGQTVWTFDEHYDLFGASRGFSSEEAYGWVEVFGPNVTSPVIVRIEDPFSTEESPTFRVEVGQNYTQTDAEGLGAFKASFLRRETVAVQAIVPYSSEYFLRDLMALEAPDRGFQESYVITGKESDVSPAGRFHILTGMLPATLAELDAFPEVTDEYSAVDAGFG